MISFIYSSSGDRSNFKLRLFQTALKLLDHFLAIKFARGSKRYDESGQGNTTEANFTALINNEVLSPESGILQGRGT